MNNLTLVGNITYKRNARTVNTSRGATTVIDFDMDARRPGADKPLYIKVTAWGKNAETIAKYADVGRNITVFGELGDLDLYNPDKPKITCTLEKFAFGGGRAAQAEAPAAPTAVYDPNVDATVDTSTGEIVSDEDNEDNGLPF